MNKIGSRNALNAIANSILLKPKSSHHYSYVDNKPHASSVQELMLRNQKKKLPKAPTFVPIVTQIDKTSDSDDID